MDYLHYLDYVLDDYVKVHVLVAADRILGTVAVVLIETVEAMDVLNEGVEEEKIELILEIEEVKDKEVVEENVKVEGNGKVKVFRIRVKEKVRNQKVL